jgi:hypothetical protein
MSAVDFSQCSQVVVGGQRFTLDASEIAGMQARLAAAGVPEAAFIRGMLELLRPGQALDLTSLRSEAPITPDAFIEVLVYARNPARYTLPPRADDCADFAAEVKAAFDFFGCGSPAPSLIAMRRTISRLAFTSAVHLSASQFTRVTLLEPHTGPIAFQRFIESEQYQRMLDRVTCAQDNAEARSLADQAIRGYPEFGWHTLNYMMMTL